MEASIGRDPGTIIDPASRPTASQVATAFGLGAGLFVGLTVNIWALISVVSWGATVIEPPESGDNGLAGMISNLMTLGVPVAWILGLVGCGFVGSSRLAASGAYLIASTVLNAFAVVALVRATDGVSIDAGGGAAFFAIPMIFVAVCTLAAGVTLTALGFILRR